MVTLKDIALHVGVSPSTVSLVLNDRDRGRVNAAVASRVREVAHELGYVPNLLARGLKTRQSRTLGVLADGVASIPFAGHMLGGAQEAAWERGYLLMLIDTGGNSELEAPAVQALLQRNIEAFILAAEYHRSVSVPLTPRSVPVVLLDATWAGPGPGQQDLTVDSVVPDEEGGAYTAVSHLLAAGHRRIGFCTVPDRDFIATDLRRRGYRRALQEAGVTPEDSWEVCAPAPDTADGLAVAEEMLARPDRPSAVFCFSDKLAMAFYQVAQRRGLSIPGDLSLVGFDNQQFVADALAPGLTTIQLPHQQMGEWASRQAIRRLQGTDPPTSVKHRMPCPLVPRESVGPPSAP